MTEQYQDEWVRGRVVSRGVRDCEGRWAMIRPLLARYRRPFTVLDLGANLGYFSLRTCEEFPEATAVAVEGDGYGMALSDNLVNNGQPRVLGLRRNVTQADLGALGSCEHFDVVLALSVAHHIPGDPAVTVDLLGGLGDHLVLELANEPGACGPDVSALMPAGAEVLGVAASHLGGRGRPVGLVSSPKRSLSRAYMGTPMRDLCMEISSSFEEKSVSFAKRPGQSRPWLRGVNLRTFRELGGFWPDRAAVCGAVREAWGRWEGPHGDIAAHNVIFAGDRADLIDGRDPTRARLPDDPRFVKMMASLEAA